MQIQNVRIVNMASRLAAIPEGRDLKIAVGVNDHIRSRMFRAGFSEKPVNGDTILPAAIGPTSRFNAEGKWLLHRDRPKESRYVGTIRWRWRQWSGRDATEEHEDERDIYRNCYPRSLIPPPSVEITYVDRGTEQFVVSPTFTNRPEMHDAIRHVVNLFLEIFGQCELVQSNLSSFGNIPIKRVSWHLLPPGRYPWDQLGPQLEAALKGRSEDVAAVIRDRQEVIKAYGPDEIYIGAGGYQGYLGYVFRSRQIVVLESIRKDNAIYVFGYGWEDFSRLSKAEVLSSHLHLARIIHAKGWKSSLNKLLATSKKAA